MSALVLDAGALLGVERGDRTVLARLRVAHQQGWELRSNAVVIAQVWRDRHGRQAALARLLAAGRADPAAHSDAIAAAATYSVELITPRDGSVGCVTGWLHGGPTR